MTLYNITDRKGEIAPTLDVAKDRLTSVVSGRPPAGPLQHTDRPASGHIAHPLTSSLLR